MQRSRGSNDPGVFETQKEISVTVAKKMKNMAGAGIRETASKSHRIWRPWEEDCTYSKYYGKSLENIIRKPDDLITFLKTAWSWLNEYCLRLYFSLYLCREYGVLPLKLNSRRHLNASRLGCHHPKQGKAGKQYRCLRWTLEEEKALGLKVMDEGACNLPLCQTLGYAL